MYSFCGYLVKCQVGGGGVKYVGAFLNQAYWVLKTKPTEVLSSVSVYHTQYDMVQAKAISSSWFKNHLVVEFCHLE